MGSCAKCATIYSEPYFLVLQYCTNISLIALFLILFTLFAKRALFSLLLVLKTIPVQSEYDATMPYEIQV